MKRFIYIALCAAVAAGVYSCAGRQEVVPEPPVEKVPEVKKVAAREYNSGLELASKGSYEAAAEKFDAALKKNPSFADAAFNLAVTQQKLGDHRKAIDTLNGIDLAKERNPEYYYALGASYFHLKYYKAAEESFLEVRKLDNGHLKAIFSLATIYGKTGRKEEAKAAWREYISIAPEGEWKQQAVKRLLEL